MGAPIRQQSDNGNHFRGFGFKVFRSSQVFLLFQMFSNFPGPGPDPEDGVLSWDIQLGKQTG